MDRSASNTVRSIQDNLPYRAQKPAAKKILAQRGGKLCSKALEIHHESRLLQRPKPDLKSPFRATIRHSTFQILHSSAPHTPSPHHVQAQLDLHPSKTISSQALKATASERHR
jgi:hypothetical protein